MSAAPVSDLNKAYCIECNYSFDLKDPCVHLIQIQQEHINRSRISKIMFLFQKATINAPVCSEGITTITAQMLESNKIIYITIVTNILNWVSDSYKLFHGPFITTTGPEPLSPENDRTTVTHAVVKQQCNEGENQEATHIEMRITEIQQQPKQADITYCKKLELQDQLSATLTLTKQIRAKTAVELQQKEADIKEMQQKATEAEPDLSLYVGRVGVLQDGIVITAKNVAELNEIGAKTLPLNGLKQLYTNIVEQITTQTEGALNHRNIFNQFIEIIDNSIITIT